MRKLIPQMQTSIDGFVGRTDEGPSGQVWDWDPNRSIVHVTCWSMNTSRRSHDHSNMQRKDRDEQNLMEDVHQRRINQPIH